MKFIILLVIVVACTANLLQYSGYNYDSYNIPGINYPSYTKPLVYHHHNNYVVKPQSPPQYPNGANGAVCATYNGIWKTFANIYQFKDEVNQGLAWNFHSYGSCPKPQKPAPEPVEPICATYKNQLRTFANALALEVENLINGKNWVKLFSGVCPHIPDPVTTTTPVPLPSTPCSTQPVCGILNGVWRTFINLTEFNAEIARGSGWSFYSFGICPKPQVCARFEDEFRTFSSALALEVEKIVSGKNWVVVSSGICTNTPATPSPTPATPTPSPATPTPSPATPSPSPATPTPTPSTPTTTSPTPSTNTPPASVDDDDFSISTTDTTEASTSKMSTTPSDPNTTTSRYSTINPPVTVDDSAATLTTPGGCQNNHRVQQNNNYHGPYVEGSFHYNHNMFNQANIKPYHSKKY